MRLLISRHTTNIIARLYRVKFTIAATTANPPRYNYKAAYDYFFAQEFEQWFCNAIENVGGLIELERFIQRLHTGESLLDRDLGENDSDREAAGQQYLTRLANSYLITDWTITRIEPDWETAYRRVTTDNKNAPRLLSSLELDGYTFTHNRLHQSEANILDIEEEKGVLQALYAELALQEQTMAFEFLSLSEDHYLSGKWSDSIANSRKFLEQSAKESARKWMQSGGSPLSESNLNRAVEVRKYLQQEGVLELKEVEALNSVYQLLSNTGSHPYLADKEQARLLRQLGLTLSHFIMLRLVVKLKTTANDGAET